MTMADQRRDVETRERAAHWPDILKKTGSSRPFLHLRKRHSRDFPRIYFIPSTAWPALLLARVLRVTCSERTAFYIGVSGA